MISVWVIVVLAVAAFAAGTVDAIAGGGGLITLPALLTAGLPPNLALGTNKGGSVWGSGAATFTFARAGRIDRKLALVTFPLGLIGSLCGASLQLLVAKEALRPIVIGMLIGAAALLVIKKPNRSTDDVDAPKRRPVAMILAFVIGAYDGFFGPGTGTFLIVGFVALCGRSLLHASADSKVVNFASNLAAVSIFAWRGTIVWEIALPMAVGQLLGGVVGTRLALKGGARIVRIMVLVVSGALIAKLIYDIAVH